MSFHIKNSAGTKLQQHTGVWMIDRNILSSPISRTGNVGNTTSNTILSGNTIYYNDTDDYWVVPIGYKLIIYEHANQAGKYLTIDNTEGTTTRVVQNISVIGFIKDTTSSVKVYYKNVEIT